MNTIGSYIKSKRKEIGLSQKDMARLLNTKEKNIIKWENDNILPEKSYINSLAEVFNTTVENILTKVNE